MCYYKLCSRVGPTHPPNTRPHPWTIAPFPSTFDGFCKLGCQLFFAEQPTRATCKKSCDYSYRYKTTVQYSDMIEVKWRIITERKRESYSRITATATIIFTYLLLLPLHFLHFLPYFCSCYFAKVGIYECFDGCDIALLTCQTGYYCTDGGMLPCPAGGCNSHVNGRSEQNKRGRRSLILLIFIC